MRINPSRGQRRLSGVAAVSLSLLLVIMLAACGDRATTSTSSGTTNIAGPAGSLLLHDRLEQLIDDTVNEVGLANREDTVERGSSRCSAPGQDGWLADGLSYKFSRINLEEARQVQRRVFDYWKQQAPKWSQTGFDVTDDGIDSKSTPVARLEIDGFSISAVFYPEAALRFRIEGTAPCVKPQAK